MIDHSQAVEAAKRHCPDGERPCECSAPACIMARYLLSAPGPSRDEPGTVGAEFDPLAFVVGIANDVNSWFPVGERIVSLIDAKRYVDQKAAELSAMLAARTGEGWRPIAEAPANDTWWHVWVPDGDEDTPENCVYTANYNKGAWDCPDRGFIKPTCYRPLPGIPNTAKGK